MAFTIQIKGKDGAIATADLVERELGIDTSNKDLYFAPAAGEVIQVANKSYVDAAVSGLLDYKGAYDANANSPDLESPSGILKGDTYTVTMAGTFYSTAVEVGDVLIAEIDEAGTSTPPESDWTIVQRNEDGIALTAAGLAQFAETASSDLSMVVTDATGTAGKLVFSNSPTLITPKINVSVDHDYIFAVSELEADRTVTLPLLTGNDTFVFAAHDQTLTNKTLTTPDIQNAIGIIDCGIIEPPVTP